MKVVIFNSNIVRLKRLFMTKFSRNCKTLNSNIVRLKPTKTNKFPTL